MPALSNPRRERFAQNIAKGMKLADAAKAAGYAPNVGNASNLSRQPDVQARIKEILEEQRLFREGLKASREIALDAERGNPTIDVNWLKLELIQNLDRARDLGEIGHANKAIELLMQLLGFTGKKERDPNRGLSNENPQSEGTINIQILNQLAERLDNSTRDEPQKEPVTTIDVTADSVPAIGNERPIEPAQLLNQLTGSSGETVS